MRAMGLVLVVSVVFVSCVERPAVDVDPVYSVKTVSAYDASGMGGVGCPDGSRVVGGGCTCKGFNVPLFSSAPAGNGYVCGCLHSAGVEPGVDMFALCLASNTAGALTQGLRGQATRDELELQRAIGELRELQRR